MKNSRGERKMENDQEQKPFVHLFQTSLGCYLYDVNTGKIISLSQKVYEYLDGKVSDEEEIE